MLASLGGVQGNLKDKGFFVQRRGRHPAFEGDAVIERRIPTATPHSMRSTEFCDAATARNMRKAAQAAP
jgi:hypothetical protein